MTLIYEYFIGLWVFIYLVLLTKLLITKNKKNILWTILKILLFALLYVINSIYSAPIISFAIYFLLIFLFIILEFSENINILISATTAIYLIRFSFDLLFNITILILNISPPSNHLMFIFTSILSFLFTITFKEHLKEKIQNADFYNSKNLILKSIFINLILVLIIFIRIPYYHNHFSTNDFMELFLFLVIFNLAIFLFREKEKNDALNKNYKKIVEYSEFTEGLLTEYKSFLHEYKNKLIIIKSLISPKNKELQNYIDSILEEKAVNHYRWLMEIKSIPISGVKGLINYKLLKMKELNIEIEVYISEEISTIKDDFLTMKEKNDLYTILGIILDNAIEASLESKEKMASLQIYKENNSFVIVLANTFKSINIDRMEEKGFSSKGKDRGIGLYLLNEIIKHSTIFNKETSIIDNFFVQKIFIKNKEKQIIPKN